MGIVLLVDDDAAVTRALRRALEMMAPWQVITAASPDEALTVLDRQEIDIIVSDEQMPPWSGAAFLAEARRRRPDTVRIILTGAASPEATMRAVNDAEIFRFLTKPCDPRALASCISEGLENRARLRAARARNGSSDGEAELAVAFEGALERIWMATQPIVTTGGRGVFGYEALVRSDDPAFPHPGALFDAARRLGETWHLERTIRERVAAIATMAPTGVAMFCNVEATSLDDPDLFDPNAPLSRVAERVVLEITERSAIVDVDASVATVARLRKLGFRVAIDDFGAGYAGLSTFAAVEPHIVKFDMDLVRDIDLSPTRAKVIASMLTLCRDLGIATVAEGVESAAERDTLEAIGFDMLQGYYFARPARPFPEVRA